MLDTDPDVARWAWYSGAYHQFHSILTLLIDLYQNPDLPEAGRINAVMDHVFGQSSAPTPQLRCATILRAIRDNMASFLTAIGAADPQSTLFDRSIPNPVIFDRPEHISTKLEQVSFADFSISESDIWWLWQPEASSFDQSGSVNS